ncbi:3-oxoacyl-(Acyl-carrier-protein) reductase [Colletotrichum higginsianum IMI 349063]|uniref:3-oxoacyl-(Acyl-carrier-protein) reductase n=1 Tax=Colletotrichum higginsianum (strain IMI 349063) TaxID=759273 RepID=A0A1B7YTU8_COLHI|nr:3-oxoacyl-(Acyl-carrier-protein) reductase [Colletotrichum higginsianum IMI 349063]OBR15475.1 3-oxoacyl-(Acyl-carrier-protein) reductase [Colletotrichum higginsianum IMI 349063]
MDLAADFSPYRADGKLHGFVCVVTGAAQPVGQAIIEELAGMAPTIACDCKEYTQGTNSTWCRFYIR